MSTYADQFARTCALMQAHQPLPGDLANWVEAQLGEHVRRDYLRLRRDQHLRTAAEIAGGSMSVRVRAIQCEAAALERCWSIHAKREPEPGTLRGAVHRARLILPIPGRRRLFAILQHAVHSPD